MGDVKHAQERLRPASDFSLVRSIRCGICLPSESDKVQRNAAATRRPHFTFHTR